MVYNPDPIGKPTFRPQHPVRLEDMRIIAAQAEQVSRAASSDDCDNGAGMGLQIGEDLAPDGFGAGRPRSPAGGVRRERLHWRRRPAMVAVKRLLHAPGEMQGRFCVREILSSTGQGIASLAPCCFC